jgi:hypothetical protein
VVPQQFSFYFFWKYLTGFFDFLLARAWRALPWTPPTVHLNSQRPFTMRSNLDACDRRYSALRRRNIGRVCCSQIRSKKWLDSSRAFSYKRNPKGVEMQSKKKQSKRARTVYRAIKSPAVADPQNAAKTGAALESAATAQNSPPPPPPPATSVEQSQAPGDVASAAVRAAAIHQLNQYAQYIEQFLQESRMRTIVNRLQAEVAPPTMEEQNYLRLRRD